MFDESSETYEFMRKWKIEQIDKNIYFHKIYFWFVVAMASLMIADGLILLGEGELIRSSFKLFVSIPVSVGAFFMWFFVIRTQKKMLKNLRDGDNQH